MAKMVASVAPNEDLTQLVPLEVIVGPIAGAYGKMSDPEVRKGLIYPPLLYMGEGGGPPPYGVTNGSVGPSYLGVGTEGVGPPHLGEIKGSAGLSQGVGPSPLDTEKEGIDLLPIV